MQATPTKGTFRVPAPAQARPGKSQQAGRPTYESLPATSACAMRSAALGGQDYFAAIVASLILLLVLVVSYMCLQLFKQRTPSKKGSMQSMIYRPACGNQWLNLRRGSCRGVSKGHPPSIETEHSYYSGHEGGACSGSFEVPP